MNRVILISLGLVTLSSAFLFGSGGGGGCGGGCGCEDTSCLPKPPKLGCQKICFSIPTLKFPSPCGCGGRKKRETNGDDTCTDPELKTLITEGIRTSPKDSRDNILADLKNKFKATRFLVTCAVGKTEFKSSAEQFCSAGNDEQTCIVVKAVDQDSE
ncbi:unnamed protein product [Auanema sp. JU1783]|nr:unnamed protein product [Auanema sp. JU1783]